MFLFIKLLKYFVINTKMQENYKVFNNWTEQEAEGTIYIYIQLLSLLEL